MAPESMNRIPQREHRKKLYCNRKNHRTARMTETDQTTAKTGSLLMRNHPVTMEDGRTVKSPEANIPDRQIPIAVAGNSVPVFARMQPYMLKRQLMDIQTRKGRKS